MSLTLRMGVPVATPVTLGDCIAAWPGIWRGAAERATFERALQAFLAVDFVRSTNSGRAALFVLLQAMKGRTSRDEVVVPAFVCPTVGRAVVKAGLRPVLCDVAPHGFGLDPHSLERAVTSRTLAVVAAHLFGYPTDLKDTVECAHDAGAMVIEDAAQAFGAKWRGCYAGTIADAGIYSFGMAKVLWSIGGGLIVTSHAELARAVDHQATTLPEVGWVRQAAGALKFAAVGALVRNHHLRPLDVVWGGAMRGKDDCDDFSPAVYPGSCAAVGCNLLKRLDRITEDRCRKAAFWSTHLAGYPELTLPDPPPHASPVSLRFPVIVRNIELKRRLFCGLRAKGINPSDMYCRLSYDAIRTFAARETNCPNAEYLTERMINLPTHAYVQQRDLNEAVEVFDAHLRGRRTMHAVSAAGQAGSV